MPASPARPGPPDASAVLARRRSGTRRSGPPLHATALVAASFLALLPLPAMVAGDLAAAPVYKCQDARGRTQYSDRPCQGRAQDYKPPELTRIPADGLTGGRQGKAPGQKSGWVSPLDPVANCEKRGGKFSREYRGCLLP